MAHGHHHGHGHGHGEEEGHKEGALNIVPVRGLENFYAYGRVSPYVSVFKATLDHGLVYWAAHSAIRAWHIERSAVAGAHLLNPDKVWATTKTIGLGTAGPILGTWFVYNMARRVYLEGGADPRGAGATYLPAAVTAIPVVALQAAQKNFRPNAFTAGLLYAMSWSEMQRLFLIRPYIGRLGKPANL